MSEPVHKAQKIALVTGASSGIGQAIAQHLDQNFYQVALLGRDLERLKATTSSFTHTHLILQADVADPLSVKKALSQLENWASQIDLLINNAGRIQRSSFLKSTEMDWSMHFQTNLFGTFRITQGVFPLLKKSKKAHVINISSSLADHPVKNTSIYSASKAAMNNWTKSLAGEWAEDHICVNAINPGLIYTPIHSFYEKTDETSQNMIQQCHKISPLGRMGTTQDVVEAVHYLIQTSWITGSVLTVDGGSRL